MDVKRRARALARKGFLAVGFEITRVSRGQRGEVRYSGVEHVIAEHLRRVGPHERYCVDIGAADGKQGSNTFRLFRDGWDGFAAECGAGMFTRLAINYAPMPRLRLYRGLVTPENVISLLDAAGAPEEFGFLSLDIDGYDHDVLRALLQKYRPTLMCVEVNEKIPPPIKFTIRYSPTFNWQGGPFHGQSISMLDELCAEAEYILLGLEYNNAFLTPQETGLQGVSVDQAYREGYLNRPDRLKLMPWNRDW